MRRTLFKTIVIIFAIGSVFTAIFAVQLGIDNDPGWGRGRYLLFVFGLLMLAWVGWDRIVPRLAAFLRVLIIKILDKVPSRFTNLALSYKLENFRPNLRRLLPKISFVPISRMGTLLTIGLVVIIGFLYLWFFSAGTMTKLPNDSHYFSMLGNAFLQRQFHLLEEPSPELMAAENPYFHKARGKIPVIWDALYFEGKYYLYWGPVPGMIVAALQPFASDEIYDPILVFSFMLGLLATSVLLLRAIWQHFDWLPRGMFVGSVFAITLNAPLMWLLTRPKVYEAAIVGGQFFLLGGFYWAFTAFRDASTSKWRFVLAGVFFALAAGTRINLAIAIAFVGWSIIWRIFVFNRYRWGSSVRVSLMFGIPLLIGAVGLMWYNQARFGAPLDFGYHYLITGPTIPEAPSNTSSIGYIIPNIYQYFLRFPDFRSEFPYVIVPWIKNDMWPALINLPRDYYYTEPVASLLLTVPVIGLAVLAMVRLGWLYLNDNTPPAISISHADRALFRWLMLTLVGCVIFAAIVLLVFIQNSYRYIVDIAPAAILLGILFLAQFRLRLKDRPFEGWIWTMSWRVCVFLTPVFGILIAITGYARAFENLNPDLYYRMLDWFP